MDAHNDINGMGTWRRYKLGQAQFTSWLKRTAEKLVAHKSEREPNANEDAASHNSQPSRRRKKKVKTPAVGIEINTGADRFVHWSQLDEFAQRIADNGRPDDIPDSALNILRDVVGLRKKSFSFFSTATKDTKDEKVRQSNASHAHIITVLERVLAKLEALVNKAKRDREPVGKDPGDHARVNISDLSNMFAYLDVQAPPDAADVAAEEHSEEEVGPAKANQRSHKGGRKKGGKKAQKPHKPERRLQRTSTGTSGGTSWIDEFDFGLTEEDGYEEDEFDLYMMVYCFFVDFNAIRNHVAERWCDYWYDRSVPLETLAVVTNTAFELFHQLEHAITKTLRPLDPELARYDFMMDMLFIQTGIEHIDYDSYDGLTREEMDERIWRDEADWLAFPSYATLHKVLDFIPPGKVPMLAPSNVKPTVYGANNLEAWGDFESSVTKQIIIEGAHIKALKTNEQEPMILPTESQVLLDIQNYLRRYDYTSAIIFCLHMWVDIRNIVEEDHSRPFEQLQVTAARLKRALETHNPTKFCRDSEFKKQWLGRIKEAKKYMLEDFLFEDKKARFRQIGVQEDPDQFYLLKHEPVWAGLLDFRAKLVYSQLGHEFVMLSYLVDAAAYLYNAAKAMDPSLPPWERMMKYVDTYVENGKFRLGLRNGQSPAAIIRNFAALASVERSRDGPAVQIGGGNLDTFIPAIGTRMSLYSRYAFEERNPRAYTVLGYTRELTAKRQQNDDIAQEGSHNGRIQGGNIGLEGRANGDSTVSDALVKRAARKTEKEHRREAALSQLSLVEMLQVLDKTVTSQLEGLLTLDYFELFDESVALLETVSAAFGPEFRDRLGPTDGDDSLAYLGRLPIHLGEELDESPAGSAKETETLETLLQACREFL